MKTIKKNKEFLLFLLFSIIFFLGGVFFLQYPLFAIPAVIIGFSYLCIDYVKTSREINKKIEGEGIPKITASDKKPTNPKEGEIWIDTGKLK